MSEVKRIAVQYDPICETLKLVDCESGELVNYADYAALKAECENWSNQCAALIKERDALATENLAIQDFDIIDFMESGPYQPNDPTLKLLKTPATDAYANKLRADAIDEFGEYHNFSGKMFIQQEAKKYAEKLRKENGNG